MSDAPLTQDDVDLLAGDLERAGSDLDWTTGFLNAVVTGPELIPPSQWMPLVFGEDAFTDLEDARQKVGRTMRWYGQIALALGETDEPIRPESGDNAAIEAFCQGYLAGTRLHPRWSKDEHAVDLLVPIGVLSGAIDRSGLRDEENRPVEDVEAHLQSYRDELGVLLAEIYEHWADARRLALRPSRRAPKVGGE
jgi:uncharacterized protein